MFNNYRFIIRFIVTGIFSAIIEFLVLVFMVEVLLQHYLISNVFAFVCANVFNYFISRIWVFVKTGLKKRIEFSLYTFFLAIGLLINHWVLWQFVEYVNIDYRLSKILAIGAVVVWNFFTRLLFVFNQNSIFTRSLSKLSSIINRIK